MKAFKKLIPIIFTLAVIVVMLVITSVSASAVSYSGKCGDDLSWSLNPSTGVLEIMGTGDMYDYSSNGPWYSFSSYIRTVNIGDSVTSIGDYAFYYCTSLKSVTIGDSVTSIGTNAFYRCASLTSVTIGDSVTSIGTNAFHRCDSLTSVTIPDSVTSIGDSAFISCSSLTSVSIGDSVTSIGDSAFRDCTSLTSVTIPDSVTSIGDSAFHRCDDLTSVHISDIASWCGISFYNSYSNPLYYAKELYLNRALVTHLVIPDSVTSIGDYAFYNCTNLTSVTIPDSVTSIGDQAFNYCPSLTRVYISDIASWCGISFYNSSSNPLYYAKELYLNGALVTHLIIPDSVTSIGNSAFRSCSSLTSVTIPDSVTSIDNYAFYNCTNLTSVTIPDSVTSIGDYAFWNTAYYNNSSNWVNNNVLYIGNHLIEAKYSLSGNYSIRDGTRCIGGYAFRSCTSLKSVTIPDSVTSIGNYAFEGCTSLTSVSIGDSVTSIGDSAFYNCTNLTSVTIPDSVTSVGNEAFNYCKSLKSVHISDIASWCGISFYNSSSNPLYYAKKLYLNGALVTDLVIPDSVTSIGNSAFYNCTSLTSVTIPDSVTSIGDYAFRSCSSLTSVTIPDSVTSVGNEAFNYCNSLKSVHISDIVSWCGISFSDSYSNPLYYAKKLYLDGALVTDLVIPDSVTSIGNSAFYNCDSLTSVTIPDSVTSIGDSAFENCSSLTSVTIPDSVTSIGDSAFNYCISLTSVTIPDSVTSIRDYAFHECGDLTSVTIGDSVTSIGDYAFFSCDSLTSVTIPDSVTSIGWQAFSYCTSLTSVTIPDSVTSIRDYAFYGSTYVTIKCYENSYAHTYAVANGFKYELIHRCVFTIYVSDNNATCTKDGTMTAVCDLDCDLTDTVIDRGTALGHSFTEYIDYEAATCTDDATLISYCGNGCGLTDVVTVEGTAFGHTWSDWIVSVEPTFTTEGEEIRFCYLCGDGESNVLPLLPDPNKPVITVDNFKVTITNADYIKDMRYALGEYTTTTEIRNAQGNVALDNATVVKYTVDGSFVYDMPNAGYYTIWLRMKDGTNYIMPLDVTKVTPSVSTYGVRITLHDLFNVKDFYIAKGEYQTYREIKDNGYIVSVTGVKIGTKHDYTYTVYEPGVHTVLIRYNDGTQALFHETLVVDEPVFTTNGLQVTVSNLPDVKVIRTAYGKWNTVKELKATDTIRNFSAKTAIKGKDPYTIQYREEGIVTVIVEYNNGYQKVFHYDVQHKQASLTQTGSSVLLRNLDGMVVIRYAPGEYSTSAEIKRAKDSKYLKPADLTNGYAIVSGLAKGTYSFCVQFDDESYNYFTVIIQ